MARSSSRAAEDRRLATGIFFVVFALYLVTYNGAFKSNDERALFSGTDSVVKRGAFTIDQIYWDYTHVGMLTDTGEMVPNYEPAPMVLAIPFYLWGRALGAAVQGTMFLGAVVTAASAALLFLALLELRYGRRTAALGAFLFAFATQAWPYSRTLFREPLTVCVYLLAFYALLRFGSQAGTPDPLAGLRRWLSFLRWPALAGLALGLALTTKQTSVALIPSLLLLAAVYEWRRGAGTRLRLASAFAALAPLVALLLLYQVYRDTTLRGVTMFARDVIVYTTDPQLSSSQLTRMVRAFLGVTVSPYKGLFWFSPALLLGLAGAWPFLRRHLWEGIACLLAIGIHLLGYSRYLYWSGGVTWGSRYMLVLIPFLVLLAAPVLAWFVREPLPAPEDMDELPRLLGWLRAGIRHRSAQPAIAAGGSLLAAALPDSGVELRQPAAAFGRAEGRPGCTDSTKPHRTRRLAVALGMLGIGCLLALSAAIQVLGVSVDWRTYEVGQFLLPQAKVWGGVGEAIDALYMVPAFSPVFGHLRLLLSGQQPLDFAWIQLRPEGARAFLPAGLALSLLAAAGAVAAFVYLWRRSGRAPFLGSGLAAGAVACSTALLLLYRTGDTRFDPYGVSRFLQPLDAALQKAETDGPLRCCRSALPGNTACNGVLIVPDEVLTDYFLNYLQARLPWYAISPRPVDTAILDQLVGRYSEIWLARDRNAASDDEEDRRGVERYLTEHAYKLDEQRFGDWARLIHFSAAGTPITTVLPAQALGDMTLEQAALGLAQPGAAQACGPVTRPQATGSRVLAQAGDTLQIGLRWRAQAKPAANYTVFIQLLDATGQVKAQADRWPGDGLFPTASLSAGQVISDNLALRLNLPPGPYHVIAGMYRNDLANLPRLAGPGGDTVALGDIDVR